MFRPHLRNADCDRNTDRTANSNVGPYGCCHPHPYPNFRHRWLGAGGDAGRPGSARHLAGALEYRDPVCSRAASQIIGRDSFSDYPPEAVSITDIGSTWETLNLEQLVALQPDLVLAAGIQSPEQVKAMEEAGLTVFLVPNPVTLEDLYTNLEVVGRLCGREAEATALIESLKARVAAVDAKIAVVNQKPKVFYELDASQDPAKPWTAGPGSFHDALIARAGGINIAAGLDSAWAQMSLEQIVAADPDFILLGDAKWGTTPESVAQRPGWSGLRAVKEGRVIPFDDDTISRPGPRLVDALENLAKILHPEIFK